MVVNNYRFQPKRPAVTEQDAEQEKALRESFKKIAGEDLEVDAYELQGILNAAFMKGVLCRYDD